MMKLHSTNCYSRRGLDPEYLEVYCSSWSQGKYHDHRCFNLPNTSDICQSRLLHSGGPGCSSVAARYHLKVAYVSPHPLLLHCNQVVSSRSVSVSHLCVSVYLLPSLPAFHLPLYMCVPVSVCVCLCVCRCVCVHVGVWMCVCVCRCVYFLSLSCSESCFLIGIQSFWTISSGSSYFQRIKLKLGLKDPATKWSLWKWFPHSPY